jgi:hypothetical protein
MAIQVQGNGGTVQEVDGTTFRAARVTVRPMDYGALGSYRTSGISGTMTAGLAANSEIFQFRWTDATRLAVVTSVTLDGVSGSATAFAAGFGRIHMIIARGWSADVAAGTSIVPISNDSKMRTSMATTLVNALRISSTGALNAGTKVLDAQSIGQVSLSFGTVVSVQYQDPVDLWHVDPGVEHPIVLAQNEGFVVRAVVPATGTWQFGITCTWTEVAAY